MLRFFITHQIKNLHRLHRKAASAFLPCLATMFQLGRPESVPLLNDDVYVSNRATLVSFMAQIDVKFYCAGPRALLPLRFTVERQCCLPVGLPIATLPVDYRSRLSLLHYVQTLRHLACGMTPRGSSSSFETWGASMLKLVGTGCRCLPQHALLCGMYLHQLGRNDLTSSAFRMLLAAMSCMIWQQCPG